MKHNPTNINYTAADIQQYLEGKMSPVQMNALEKAALEDPFLQEAIEGYEAMPAETWKPVLQGLHQGFAAPASTNNDTAKVVGFGRKRFGWIKYAAAILIVGGGFTTIYLINQNRTNGPAAPTVAATEKSETNAPTLNDAAVTPKVDSINTLATNKPTTTNNTFANTTTANTIQPGTVTFRDKLKAVADSTRFATIDIEPAPSAKLLDVKEEVVVTAPAEPAEKKKYAPPSPVPVTQSVVKPAPTAGYTINDYYVAKKKDVAAAEEKADYRFDSAGRKQNARFFNQQTINTNQGLLGNNANNNEVNRSFVAQVVDDNNNPLPFANINVKNEGFGTYADAKGNVRLISTDSIIPIEVKSLGFQSQTIVLRSTQQPATIRLKEDAAIAYQEKTIDRKQATTNVMSRRAYLQRDAEQNAEPADGWEKYDTYISNNLVIPDDLVKKNVHGEVALSFDVQKNGAISNIKVDKSLCTDCDEIAKRVVAQGPQWKVKKGKKAKAKVTVQF
jgi:hypothetical protein